jgi:hypothetical protein
MAFFTDLPPHSPLDRANRGYPNAKLPRGEIHQILAGGFARSGASGGVSREIDAWIRRRRRADGWLGADVVTGNPGRRFAAAPLRSAPGYHVIAPFGAGRSSLAPRALLLFHIST